MYYALLAPKKEGRKKEVKSSKTGFLTSFLIVPESFILASPNIMNWRFQ